MLFKKLSLFIIFVFLFFLNGGNNFAKALEVGQSLDDLNQQIKNKQDKLKEIESQIEVYQKNIEIKQKESVTLNNQLSILQSRIAKAALDLLASEAKISELSLIIDSLQQEISLKENKIAEQKKLLAGLIHQLDINNPKNYLSVILTADSFSDYFNQVRYIEEISANIDQALENVKKNHQELAGETAKLQEKLHLMEDFKKQQKQNQLALEEQKQARESLLKETKSSEIKFKVLLEQLRADNASLNNEVTALQREIEKRLTGKGLAAGALTWPVDTDNGLSTLFHDPTYPFRYLFEHSGLDIRLPQGTPVKASAPGYVAWAKTNRFYGNNIMIVHANNIVTLYAHLSRFNVSPDNFVAAGQVIGWSGGIPGTPGAGFSTGPHLHFEVRVNGEPQDPLAYVSRNIASR